MPQAVPLQDFPIQPPAEEDQFAVLFGLELKSGAVEGAAVGVELTYRQGGKLRRQEFPAIAYVCRGVPIESDCADGAMGRFDDYDQEVKKRVKPPR